MSLKVSINKFNTLLRENDEELRRLERAVKADPSNQTLKDQLHLVNVRAGKAKSSYDAAKDADTNYNKRWKKIDKAPGDITFPQRREGLRKQVAFDRNSAAMNKHIVKAQAANYELPKEKRDRANASITLVRRGLKLLSAATKEIKAHPEDTITTGRADKLARLAKRAELAASDKLQGNKIGHSRKFWKDRQPNTYMSTRDWAKARRGDPSPEAARDLDSMRQYRNP
jgi:poly-D-alanine transfer protein DltD